MNDYRKESIAIRIVANFTTCITCRNYDKFRSRRCHLFLSVRSTRPVLGIIRLSYRRWIQVQ